MIWQKLGWFWPVSVLWSVLGSKSPSQAAGTVCVDDHLHFPSYPCWVGVLRTAAWHFRADKSHKHHEKFAEENTDLWANPTRSENAWEVWTLQRRGTGVMQEKKSVETNMWGKSWWSQSSGDNLWFCNSTQAFSWCGMRDQDRGNWKKNKQPRWKRTKEQLVKCLYCAQQVVGGWCKCF